MDRLTHVVDIGANPIDNDRPYAALLAEGLCQLTGFEPHSAALERLVAKAGAHERYLPFALGDGEVHTLNICRYSGWTSLLQPSRRALQAFPFYQNNAEVIKRQDLQTHRLDEIEQLVPVDFLKIDVQGSELMVFRHGRKTLNDVVVLQTEVSLALLYDDQAAFGEVDSELRRSGMMPFNIAAMKPYSRTLIEGRHIAGTHQILEADILYVRDYTRPERITKSQLGHFALLMHSLGGYDLAHHLFELLEMREEAPRGVANEYAALLWNAKDWAETMA